MEDDQAMQEDLSAAIALSLEGGSEWSGAYDVMEQDQEESEAMQLSGSPQLASFMEHIPGYFYFLYLATISLPIFHWM